MGDIADYHVEMYSSGKWGMPGHNKRRDMPEDNKDLKINIYENNTTNPKAPAFKGFATIGGIVHEVALWPAKNGKKGSYSGFMKVKEDRAQQTRAAYKDDNNGSSDIPF